MGIYYFLSAFLISELHKAKQNARNKTDSEREKLARLEEQMTDVQRRYSNVLP